MTVVPVVPMEAVEVTGDNLEAVVSWLGHSLGICEVRDGRIYANLYDGPDSAEIIDPGTWVVKCGDEAVALTAAEFVTRFAIA